VCLRPQTAGDGEMEAVGIEAQTDVAAHQGECGKGALRLPATGDGAGQFRIIGNDQYGRLIHVPLLFLETLASGDRRESPAREASMLALTSGRCRRPAARWERSRSNPASCWKLQSRAHRSWPQPLRRGRELAEPPPA
jgi:hypothetical protein